MKNNIKIIRYFSFFLILFSFNTAFSQCTTEIRAARDTIACGEGLLLTNIPPLSGNGDDFSSGNLDPAFWDIGLSNFTGMITATSCQQPASALCNNPAPSAPLFWFPGGSPGNLTTTQLDISCGGTISFDYRQETQSSAPCDGPDQANEGMYFQYKNGGGAWVQIFYFLPPYSGGPASYNCWNNYSYIIPPGAIGPNTRFRWYTTNTSSAGWDQWGMDNISISQPAPCGNPYVTSFFGPNIPTPYNLDTITVYPYADSAIYSVSVSNGVNTCTDSFTVYVEQPTIISSIILAACAGSDTLDAQATITANCNYTLELWNYLPGSGATQPGWSTGSNPGTYHKIDININGSFYSNYSITTGGNLTSVSYSIPVTDGDQLDAIFFNQGNAADECMYRMYDSDNIQLTLQGFPGSIPQPYSTPVTCPATASYNYSWQNLTSGGVSGLNNPNIQNPLATVAVTTQFEVTAYDSLHPQCIAIDTVTVLPNANPISATLTGNTAICTGDPLTLNFVLVGGAPYDVDLLITPLVGPPTNVTYQLDAFGLIIPTGLPITFYPTQNTTYSILSISDITGCPASVTNPTLIVVVNDPPNAGVVNINPITLCKNDIASLYLPNNLSGSPDLNGTWSFIGAQNPLYNLPFNGINYILDPSEFPSTTPGNYHTFKYEVSPVPGCIGSSMIQILVAIEDAPSAGTLPSNSIDICLDGTAVDLNSLFNSTLSCPSCTQPSPFTGLNWTDVSGGTPGTIIINPLTWTPIASGTYTIRYTADISVNCPSTDFEEITINVSDLPTATFSTSATANQACLNDNVDLIFSPTGVGNFTIQYFDAGGTLNSVTVNANSDVILTGNPISIPTYVAGNFTYWIQDIVDLGAGATGCTGSAFTDVNLLVTNPPQSGVTTSNTICEDDITLHNLNMPPFFPTGGDAGGAWTYGISPVASGTFQASDNLGNSIDPFGAYTYTVTDALGICPDEFTNITITAETPPNTGIANTNMEICVNAASITSYNLFQLLDGSQGITGTWLYNGIVVANPIDLTAPIFNLGTPAISTTFSFAYQLVPTNPLSSCTNNGALPYSTSSNLTIHPEPKIDPTTPTATPLTVFQTLSTTIFVNMLEGSPPFTVNLIGNEIPMGTYSPFIINPGMSGSGPATPNYDILNNPVTISITSITDGNNCTSIPGSASVDVTVEPFPIITASSSNIELCEGLPLDIIFEGIQGIPAINIDLLINGTAYNTATSAINGIAILNTPTSSDISSLLSIGSNLIQIINIVDAGGNICPNSLLPPNFTIIINENPSLSNFSSNSPICENENAEISFSFNSGLAPFTIDYNYSINTFPLSPPLSQITCNTTHMEVLLLLPEDYTFFITSFTDDNGCIGILPPNINLIVNETPIITLNSFLPSEICEGNTIPLNLQTPINLSTPAVPYTLVINSTDSYSISNNGTIFSGANIGNLISYTQNNAGVYPFIITEFYDDNGCGIIDPVNNTATLTVNENADMIVTSTADTGEVCQGDLAYINFEFTNGTAPWEVTFIKDGNPIILPPYNNSITIPQSLYTYSTSYDIISLKDAKGCNKDPFDKDFDIIANPLPIAELYSNDRFICDDGSTTEMIFTINSGTPAYNVSYSIGLENKFLNINTNSTPLALATNQVGIWKITEVVDSKGCIADEKGGKVTISLNPSPIASFVAYPQPTDVNNPFVNFIDNSTGHTNAVWNFYNNITNDTIMNNSRFIHEFSANADTHLVTLNIISDSGCVSSITQSIFINEAFSCFIPTGFTPNNDLYNDHFLPVTRGVTDYKLSIYDRFGSRVFETNKYTDTYCMYGCDQAWDGKINNGSEYAPTGNYVYNIVIIDFNGKERIFDGTVTLNR